MMSTDILDYLESKARWIILFSPQVNRYGYSPGITGELSTNGVIPSFRCDYALALHKASPSRDSKGNGSGVIFPGTKSAPNKQRRGVFQAVPDKRIPITGRAPEGRFTLHLPCGAPQCRLQADAFHGCNRSMAISPFRAGIRCRKCGTSLLKTACLMRSCTLTCC